MSNNIDQYLAPSHCINSDAEEIIALTAKLCEGFSSDKDKTLAIYYWVRDQIRYNPYTAEVTQESLCATKSLEVGEAWCVSKAVLMAALCRASGIPARLGFADVVNHLSTERLRQSMKTDVFYFHGYCSVFLSNKWVKCTPAFNLSLCEKFNLQPLEFDGVNDSLYHEFDNDGNKHMEYVSERGEYIDVPLVEMEAVFNEYYPSMKPDQNESNNENSLSVDDWETDVNNEISH